MRASVTALLLLCLTLAACDRKTPPAADPAPTNTAVSAAR